MGSVKLTDEDLLRRAWEELGLNPDEIQGIPQEGAPTPEDELASEEEPASEGDSASEEESAPEEGPASEEDSLDEEDSGGRGGWVWGKSSKLTPRERLFIHAFLGEARGNASLAARLAGYSNGKHGSMLLARPRVRAAIRAALEREAEEKGITKDYLLVKAKEVLEEGRPFERLKAIETIARIMGYFAPTRTVTEKFAYGNGPSSYAELAATLREYATSLTPEQRAGLRQRTLEDIAEAQRVLAMLDDGSAH